MLDTLVLPHPKLGPNKGPPFKLRVWLPQADPAYAVYKAYAEEHAERWAEAKVAAKKALQMCVHVKPKASIKA
eukprot:4018348-Amphidinium_carterae.1